MRMSAWMAAVLATGLSGPAAAHDFKLDAITIAHPWARATPVKVTAAFFTLRNDGKTTIRLVSITSPVAGRVEIHTSEMKDGVARMRKVEGITVPPGKSVTLKPGGFHVMLMGLKYPVRKGGKIPMTLHFAKAGHVTVRADVAGPGAMKPGH